MTTNSTSPTAPSAWVTRGVIGVLSLIWGSTWIVIAKGLASLPPFTSAGVRFTLAAVVMALIAPHFARKEGGAKPKPALWVQVGLTSFTASYAIVYWTETRLPSAITCILWSVFPMTMALSSHFFLGHRLRGVRPWLGFALGFVGVVLLYATDVRALGPEALVAALVLLGSPLVSCYSTTVLKRDGAGVSSVLVNRNGMALGALLLSALAFLFERDLPRTWDGTAIASIVYLALVGTVLGFGLYFWLLRHVPAHEVALISYLTPAVAVVLGAVFGGEQLTLFTLAGCATILAGVYLVMRPVKRSGDSSA